MCVMDKVMAWLPALHPGNFLMKNMNSTKLVA